jgi:hypothetical protein
MNLAQLIGKLKPTDRRHLEEMVRHQPLNEADGGVITAAVGVSSAAVGAQAKAKNGVTFVKTASGWRADLEVTTAEVLQLVQDASKGEVEKVLKRLGVGKDYEISSGILNPGIDAPGGSLTFRKTGNDKFIDPTYLTDDRMKSLLGGSGVAVAAADAKADASTASKPDAATTAAPAQKKIVKYSIGNITFNIGESVSDRKVTINVPNPDDFETLFGPGVKKVLANSAGGNLKIPVKLAADDSIFKILSKNVFVNLGTGSIEFERSGENFATSFELTPKQMGDFRAEMGKLVNVGKAAVIEESRGRGHSVERVRGMAALKGGEKLGFKHDPADVSVSDKIAADFIRGRMGAAEAALLQRPDLTMNVVSALKSEGHYDLAARAEAVGYSINETRRRVRLLLRKLY